MSRLARHLAQEGKTQRWLAAQIGVRPATVCAWCKGASVPRPEHMVRIAQVTEGHVPIETWFDVTPRQEDAA